MEVFIEQVDLAEFAAQTAARWSASERNLGNTVSTRLGRRCPDVFTDVAKLERIVGVLVQNAVRFTNNGTIEIVFDTTQDASGGDERWLSIAVRDTGMGIAPENMAQLFEVFVNRDDATPSNYGSAGLGLPLCDRLCRLLGGTVTVETEPRKGSTFTVRLPGGRAGQTAAAERKLAKAA
jgi:signal transduction histidine kinase